MTPPPNTFLVGTNGETITIGLVGDLIGRGVSKEQAISLAVWVAVLADPLGDRFDEALAAARAS